MIKVGARVRTKKYGAGHVLIIDAADSYMTYYCTFADGTHIWLPKDYFSSRKASK